MGADSLILRYLDPLGFFTAEHRESSTEVPWKRETALAGFFWRPKGAGLQANMRIPNSVCDTRVRSIFRILVLCCKRGCETILDGLLSFNRYEATLHGSPLVNPVCLRVTRAAPKANATSSSKVCRRRPKDLSQPHSHWKAHGTLSLLIAGLITKPVIGVAYVSPVKAAVSRVLRPTISSYYVP